MEDRAAHLVSKKWESNQTGPFKTNVLTLDVE